MKSTFKAPRKVEETVQIWVCREIFVCLFVLLLLLFCFFFFVFLSVEFLVLIFSFFYWYETGIVIFNDEFKPK